MNLLLDLGWERTSIPYHIDQQRSDQWSYIYRFEEGFCCIEKIREDKYYIVLSRVVAEKFGCPQDERFQAAEFSTVEECLAYVSLLIR